MGRFSLVRWSFVVAVLFCGCKMPGSMRPSTWFRASDRAETKDAEKVAAVNPFLKSGDPAKQDDAKQDDKGGKIADNPSGQPAIAMHDADTLALIEQELRSAPPEEREQLFNDLKDLDPSLVRQILKMRRMVRTMGQNAPARQIAQVSATNSNSGELSPTAIPELQLGPVSKAEAGRQQPLNQRNIPGAGNFSAAGQLDGVNAWDRSSPSNRGVSGNQSHSSMTNSNPFGAQSPRFEDPRSKPFGQNPQAARLPNGSQAFGYSSAYGPATPGGASTPSAGPAMSGPSNQYAGTVNQLPETPQLPGVGMNGRANQRPGSHLEGLGLTIEPATSANALAMQSSYGNPNSQATSNLTSRTMNTAFGAPAYTPSTSPGSASWNEGLQKLIASAAADTARVTPGTTAHEKRNYIEKNAYLRMLYLMAGQQERALEPIAGIDPADQEFWQQMFWGIANYFDVEAMPEAEDRATQTITQLRSAIQRLQENSRLELRNVTFCHKISSFGNYERFQRDEFSPGQPVLIYSEVDNFKSEPATDGQFRTILRSSIEIYKAGSSGDLVERMEFPATEDLCRNYRRDYFHSYEFTIPPRISLGPHVMKLTVEDQLSRKVATYTLNFTVK